MEEILPRLVYWTTFHEGIHQEVGSYYEPSIEAPAGRAWRKLTNLAALFE